MSNFIDTDKAPKAIGPYSQAVVSGNFVYTSGQIAINHQSGNVESDTIEGQTEQVCKNISELLKASGSGIDMVVKTTCFLRDMADFVKFNTIYEKYFVSKPARSCVAVRELPKNVLVEIDTVAEREED